MEQTCWHQPYWRGWLLVWGSGGWGAEVMVTGRDLQKGHFAGWTRTGWGQRRRSLVRLGTRREPNGRSPNGRSRGRAEGTGRWCGRERAEVEATRGHRTSEIPPQASAPQRPPEETFTTTTLTPVLPRPAPGRCHLLTSLPRAAPRLLDNPASGLSWSGRTKQTAHAQDHRRRQAWWEM